jgi:hypothetical protein
MNTGGYMKLHTFFFLLCLLFPMPQIETCRFVSRHRLHLALTATACSHSHHAQPPPLPHGAAAAHLAAARLACAGAGARYFFHFPFLVKCILGNVFSYYIIYMYLGIVF